MFCIFFDSVYTWFVIALYFDYLKMINVIDPWDENKNIQEIHDAVFIDLKNEKNVNFEGEKVKFSKTEFANIKESLNYLNKQENILLQKNREKNGNIVKEVSEILDNIEKKWFLDEYSATHFSYEKWIAQKIKGFLKSYQWHLTLCMRWYWNGKQDYSHMYDDEMPIKIFLLDGIWQRIHLIDLNEKDWSRY